MGHDAFAEELREVTAQLLRKLRPVMTVTGEMGDAIRVLCHNEAHFARHQPIIEAGQSYSNVFLVHSGWAVRFKLLENGDRQIVNFVLPGDFMCFNAALFGESDFYLTAQTEVIAYVMPIVPFAEMLRAQPQLALALSWTNAHEEALLAERIVSLGRRSARERMAHLFCELWRRLQLLDMIDGGRFPLPMTQEDLADTLGLSAVHVNRTLRWLRGERLVETGPSHVRILDMPGLERIAGFDAGYLHFTETHKPRF
ncbi:MAG: Crp/Fnr family transcriptional regulator [Alphaproteobacteria bacterium]